MYMKIRKPLKHKGFIAITRRTTLLLRDGGLDFGDYGFYLFLLLETDWSRKHVTYGCIPKTSIDLAIDSGTDPSTISRRKEKLLKYGLIEETEDGMLKIKDFEKFTIKLAVKLGKMEVASLQEDIAQTQSIIAETQEEIARMHEVQRTSSNSFKDYPFNQRVSNDEDVSPDDIPF
jgi:hypothetical protein